MFERFTEKARRVVVLAQEEARMLNHNYIGTEHILLGLLSEDEGVAARALRELGIALVDAREDVEEIIGQGQAAPTGHIPFTPRAKKVLELSLREALQLGHNYIGTEHVLLGLIREGEGVAAQVLHKRGADLGRVRETVVALLAGYAGEAAAAVGWGDRPAGGAVYEPMREGASGEVPEPERFPTCPRCGAALAETIACRALDVTVGDERTPVTIVYCGRCGAALGTLG